MTAAVSLDQAIRAWFSTRLEIVPCDEDIEAHESLQMAAHAVLAVLDVHKPGMLANGNPVCYHCYELGAAGDERAYPCLTVRAIAEKLGVEVHGG